MQRTADIKRGRIQCRNLPLVFLDECTGFAFPSAVHAVVKIEQYIGTVNDTVHHSRHDKSSGYVKYGVLLDEHGR